MRARIEGSRKKLFVRFNGWWEDWGDANVANELLKHFTCKYSHIFVKTKSFVGYQQSNMQII